MRVEFIVLYKSGHEDVFVQEVEDEFDERVVKVNECIVESFKNDMVGIITFGDGDNGGAFVRLSDVSRVRIEIIPEEGT